ncbi:MAG: hypothetical protein MUO53_13705 [Maribacter sp.]|nr:hypothetical protein [Maribacter sp.]
MKSIQDILMEVTQLTNTIETKYPELYQFLDENPVTIPDVENPEIDKEIMLKYLGDLKQMLKQYAKTHKKDA